MSYRQLLNPRFLFERRHRLAEPLLGPLAAHGLLLTQNDRRLASLRNRHKGERAFILGNGPSLTPEDLSRLTGEITFACNKIYLCFDQTDWRPTYYSVADILVAEQNTERILETRSFRIFPTNVRHVFRHQPDILWVRDLSYTRWLKDPAGKSEHGKIPFSVNSLRGVFSGLTVLYFQLQLAYYMGVDLVYLMGVDFSFHVSEETKRQSAHGEEVLGTGEVNHFHPDYRAKGERWTMPRLDLQKISFQSAKEAFESDGRRVLNASRQTKLEVLPTVSLDDVLEG